MLGLEILVVLGAIFIGARFGSIGIGYAGGLGVLVLTLGFGLEPGSIPIDVILIIMSVIAAIAAMQVAGGLDYMVKIAEGILRRNPKHITYLAPAVTYWMTILAGTGHTAYSTLPVIAEVAKEQGIRPSRPLGIAVVGSQIAITASPISAALVFLSGILEPLGVGYIEILAVTIPTTFSAVMITAFVSNFLGKDLVDDKVYKDRLEKGLIKLRGETKVEIKKGAKLSVAIFITTIFSVVTYATLISKKVAVIVDPSLPRNAAIMVFMLACASLIVWACKVDTSKILNASTFKSGMSACICVLGVAWLGTTFVGAHLDEIKEFASTLLTQYPWMLAITLFFASMLLYSQGATTKALMPAALALGVDPVTAVASFAAVSALFVLPTYPTLIAAVEMDDTGSTRIGKYVFNHPFIVPGVIAITLSVIFGFMLGNIIL